MQIAITCTSSVWAIINWIKYVYNDTKSRIIVNRCCSDIFLLKRAVKQGDCLSPLLFALSIEPLGEYIRLNLNIKNNRQKRDRS